MAALILLAIAIPVVAVLLALNVLALVVLPFVAIFRFLQIFVFRY